MNAGGPSSSGARRDLYPVGTLVMVAKVWNGYPDHAVYLGAVGRGLHAVAVADTWRPFYVDPDDGSRCKLRRAVWAPRRVRATSILGTVAAHDAAVQAQRVEAVRVREAAERDSAERQAAARALVDVLDALAVRGLYVYPDRGAGDGAVRVSGSTSALVALAERIRAAGPYHDHVTEPIPVDAAHPGRRVFPCGCRIAEINHTTNESETA